MWTDIDYMDRRRVFTLDPERYPLEKMRELVDYLHKHDQHYIVMVDPAVSDSGKTFNQCALFIHVKPMLTRTLLQTMAQPTEARSKMFS